MSSCPGSPLAEPRAALSPGSLCRHPHVRELLRRKKQLFPKKVLRRTTQQLLSKMKYIGYELPYRLPRGLADTRNKSFCPITISGLTNTACLETA